MPAAKTAHSPIPFLNLAAQHEPLKPAFVAAFERVLGSSGFILGQEVAEFEARFAAACGTQHCIGVNSGTAALQIVLEAAGIGAGDEVIVPAHTFIATALAVRHAGATPVCVDVQAETGLIDPDAVAAVIGARTAAILPVHLYGQVCAMDELRALAHRHGLFLLEDAAQAHGATYRGRPAGGLGSAAAFSFYPSKNLGALGDGGAICTSDDRLADRARHLRDLGRSGSSGHDLAGYNERLDGMQAAFLQIKLQHLDEWNRGRRGAAALYRERLPGVQHLTERSESPCVYHLFPIRIENRDLVGESLRALGISTGVHYPLSLPDQPALPELHTANAPNAREWAASELSLPIFPGLTTEQVDIVSEALAAQIR